MSNNYFFNKYPLGHLSYEAVCPSTRKQKPSLAFAIERFANVDNDRRGARETTPGANVRKRCFLESSPPPPSHALTSHFSRLRNDEGRILKVRARFPCIARWLSSPGTLFPARSRNHERTMRSRRGRGETKIRGEKYAYHIPMTREYRGRRKIKSREAESRTWHRRAPSIKSDWHLRVLQRESTHNRALKRVQRYDIRIGYRRGFISRTVNISAHFISAEISVLDTSNFFSSQCIAVVSVFSFLVLSSSNVDLLLIVSCLSIQKS